MTNVQSIPSPSIHTEERAHEADHPSSLVAAFGVDQPLRLDCGIDLSPFQIAYQTYGELNADRSNAIMICHALTLDQHVANVHPLTGKPGWWEIMVGPGRPLDTDRYFIICSNVIGGCMGSTGPASTNPATGKVWGLDFPIVTIPDMVRAQAMLLDRLGIETLLCVIGGSMGGMQALQWTAAYPDRVFSALAVACSTRHSAQNIAFHELGRQAVMADPDWRGGRYFDEGTHPHRGLGVARMAGHITYLSDAALHRKFGRRMQDRELPTFSFDADFQVESYLRYQGSSFVERFDANSYLYLTRAMDYFDIAADHDGVLARAFGGIKTRFCVVSFTSDWLFPTPESRALVHALNASSARVSFAEIETDRGHDAFLLDVSEFFDISRAFLQSAATARGLGNRAASMSIQQTLPFAGVTPHRTADYRSDHLLVAEMVERGSKVLDVGCGDGELLQLLESRGIDGRGIELSREGVNRCVAKGLAVVQGDADTDLVNYPDDAFDYVILSQTLQATRQPRVVLENLLRIGRRAIVSFPNFGFWRMRLQLLIGGHMPRTENLPATWYDTPNIHFCTIKDFVQLCDEINVKMERAVALDLYGRPLRLNLPWWFWNMFGEQGVFLLSRAEQTK